MDGWIKLHRKFLKWEWYDDINVKAVFLDLLLNASYEEHDWHGQTLKKGTCVTSVSSIAKRNKLSAKQVRTALSKLEKTGEIGRQRTNKFSVVTICKYAEYQDVSTSFCDSAGQSSGNQEASKRQSKGNIQEMNKEINKEMNNIFSTTTEGEMLKNYSDEDKTELFPGSFLTVAEYDYLSKHIPTNQLERYIHKIIRNCKNPFLTIIRWAKQDGYFFAELEQNEQFTSWLYI